MKSKKVNQKKVNGKHSSDKTRHPNAQRIVTFHDDTTEEHSFYDDDDDGSGYRSLNHKQLKNKAGELLKVRSTLPVYQNRTKIMDYITANQVTILIGETGSGKSTQIPQFLLDYLYARRIHGSIAVTQPRRVAAINLATRVANEHGCNLGDQVGYSVRFDTVVSGKTRLKYLTDGMLLRELMMNKKLEEYSVIIIDEAHERTILTDLILGFLKTLIHGERPDLKLIVMSATLQAERFSAFFDNAPILFVEGRKYNVSEYYLSKPSEDIVDSMIKAVVQVNQGEPLGDILCFLPGQEEIDKAVTIIDKISEVLHKETSVPLMVPLPLYAALSPRQQAEVFLPLKGFKRKVVFSTNIAETSVTVPGVRYVIDSGLRKVKVWRHQLGLATLLTVPISRASAQQRTGRAGREAEGKAFHLYCEGDVPKLPEQTEPEIVRSDVTSPVLMLKRYGVEDIVRWSWFENPGRDAILMGLQELYQLGALDDFGHITKVGRQMALLPIQPHLSSVLIRAHDSSCLDQVIDIVACLSVENLLLSPQPEERDEVNERRLQQSNSGLYWGDLILLKDLFDVYFYDLNDRTSATSERKAWCKELCISYRGFKNVVKIREQLRGYCKKLFPNFQNGDDLGNSGSTKLTESRDEITKILKCFLVGFAKNTAIGMPDRSYRTVVTGETISVHPSSALFMNKQCPAIMYIEYVFTTKGYARNVSRIELSWLQETLHGVAATTKERI